MKKSILSFAAALLLVVSACTEEKELEFVVALSNDYEFDVTASGGTFTVSDVVSIGDLQDISNDIDQELKDGLKRVSVEAVEVRFEPGAGNNATSVGGSLVLDLGDGDILIFDKQEIPVDGTTVSITSFAAAGQGGVAPIAAIKSKFEEVLNGTNDSDISGEASGSITGGNLEGKLFVSIKASVVGGQTVELPNL